MSHFMAKMYQITALPQTPTALRGPTSKRRGGDETPTSRPLSHISGYAPDHQHINIEVVYMLDATLPTVSKLSTQRRQNKLEMFNH